MKAVIYTRISRDKTGAGLGVERQLEDCRALAESLGWTVAAEYSDNDISASSGRVRPGYRTMLEEMKAGNVDAILAWHTDRLHRRPLELEEFIDICDRHTIEIRTVRGGDLDLSTASGRMVARMLGAAARHEVEHMSERQKRQRRQKALAGGFSGGRRSFGYTRDGMELEPAEADLIRTAYKDVLAGVSLRTIGRRWTESGLLTAYGNKLWMARDLKRVLLRVRNAGFVLVDGQRVPAQWPAIIDVDTFDAVAAALSDPARRTSFSFERVYMGTGAYVCSKCGSTMKTTRTGRSRTAYRCKESTHLVRDQQHVDELVSEVIISRLSSPDAKIALGGDTGADLDRLQTRRAAINARLQEVADLFAEGAVTADQLRSVSAKLRDELAGVESQIVRAQESSALAALVLDEGGVREAWERLTPDLKHKLVTTLVTVTILPTTPGRKAGGLYFDPESVQIEWKA